MKFSIVPAAVDEVEVKRSLRAEGASAVDAAVALAALKAAQVSRNHPQALVIGADQLLECDGLWFDKPARKADARAQLQALRGRAHDLCTAVCVVREEARLWHHVERPRLAMRAFSDEFLESYLRSLGGAALEAVGAYRLEGRGAQLFERVEGDYFAVLGLPLLPLLAFLRGHGVVQA